MLAAWNGRERLEIRAHEEITNDHTSGEKDARLFDTLRANVLALMHNCDVAFDAHDLAQ